MARIIPKNEYQNLKTRDAPMPSPRPQPHLLSLSFPSSFMIYDKAANPLGQLWTRVLWKTLNNCSRNTGGRTCQPHVCSVTFLYKILYRSSCPD